MTEKTETRTVYKTICVPVEITPFDLLKALSVAELKAECARRQIELKGAGKTSAPKHKIERTELDDVVAYWRGYNFNEALFKLEWALPKEFRGFADAVMKHYGSEK
jgi:hypothetical protein